MAGSEVAGSEVAVFEVSGFKVEGFEVSGSKVSGSEVAVSEVAVFEVAVWGAGKQPVRFARKNPIITVSDVVRSTYRTYMDLLWHCKLTGYSSSCRTRSPNSMNKESHMVVLHCSSLEPEIQSFRFRRVGC